MSGKLYWRIKKNGKWTWKPAKKIERFLEMESEWWVYTDEGIAALEEEE